jgi:hypothetical protein
LAVRENGFVMPMSAGAAVVAGFRVVTSMFEGLRQRGPPGGRRR